MSAAWKRVFVVVAVAAAGLAGLAWYASSERSRARHAFDQRLGALELERFQLAGVAGEDNAATWLLRGAAAISPPLDPELSRALRPFPAGDLDPGLRARAERAVATHRGALELMQRAVGRQRSSFGIDYAAGPEAALPPLLDLLQAGRLAALDGHLALLAGERRRAADALGVLDRLGAALAAESTLVTALVTIAVDRYYLDLLHHGLSVGGLAPETLAGAAAALAGRDRGEAFRRGLAADGAMIVSAEGVGPQEHGGAGSLLSRLRRHWVWPLEEARLLDGYVELVEALETPFADLWSEPAWQRGSGWVATYLPNLADAVAKLKALESEQALARAAVERALAAAEAADAPARLEADPYTGRRWRLTTTATGAPGLEAPGAAALWRAVNPGGGAGGPPHFLWPLPAPTS